MEIPASQLRALRSTCSAYPAPVEPPEQQAHEDLLEDELEDVEDVTDDAHVEIVVDEAAALPPRPEDYAIPNFRSSSMSGFMTAALVVVGLGVSILLTGLSHPFVGTLLLEHLDFLR